MPYVKPLAAFALLVLLAGCAPDVPEAPADDPAEAETGWQVNVAEPEEGEAEEGTILLTRHAEADGSDGYPPRLVLGCEDGVTEAYVEWGVGLGAAEIPVTYHVDDAPPQAARWRVSDDGEAAGLWADSVSVPFLRTLLGHGRLTAAVAPASGPALTGTFVLAGLDSLIAPVQTACEWD